MHVGNRYEVGRREEGRSSSRPMHAGDSPLPPPTPLPPPPAWEEAALDTETEENMRLAGAVNSLMPATMQRVMPETQVPTDEELIETLRTLQEVLFNALTQVRLCGEPRAHERENVRNALTELEHLILEAGKGAGMLRSLINQRCPRWV